MNRLDIATLALVGWYLMVPPITSDPLYPNQIIGSHRPISEWIVKRGFDYADDCEAEMQLAQQDFLRNWRQSGEENTAQDLIRTQDASGQCIATDDPRLKGN